MKFTYQISHLALKDLDEIWEYTAEQWSKQQANKYYKEIFQRINEICINAATSKAIDEIKMGHRRINVKAHMIIFKIKADTIYIDRILHQKMDLDKHLNE